MLRRMMKHKVWLWTVVTLAVCCVAFVFLSGCGGGGGGGIPGFTQGGAPYTPPENVVSKKEQVRKVVYEAADRMTFFSPAELEEELTTPHSWGIDAVDNLFEQLGVGERVRGRSVNHRGLIVGLTKWWLKPRGARIVRGSQQIDWTDPELNIHWTGTYTETENKVILDVTGVGEGTRIHLRMSAEATEDKFSLSMSMDGTVPEDVWFEGESRLGIARVRLSFSFSGTQSEGRGSLRAGYEATLQQTVVERWVEEGSLSYTVSGEQIRFTFKDDSTHSERVGDGLFWVRTIADLTFKGSLEEEQWWDTVTGTVTGNASNRMTSRIEIKEDGTVNGWVKDSAGTKVADITGNIETEVKLVHSDGTVEILYY